MITSLVGLAVTVAGASYILWVLLRVERFINGE